MKRKLIVPIWILSISLAVTGCNGTSNKQPNTGNEQAQQNNTQTNETETAESKAETLKKEREALEAERKKALGEFYVPLPELGQEHEIKKVKARALYLTANVAGFDFDEKDIDYYADYIDALSGKSGKKVDNSRLGDVNKLEKALGICKATEVNALVIDIKNDDGLVAWNSDIEVVGQLKSNWNTPLKQYDKLMAYLDQNDIYKIARIVAFKDPYFAKANPDHAIQLKTGGVYKDRAGTSWVNPFDKYVWNYVVSIARESALRGFNEIQFDYVRFPDGASYYNPITEFPGRDNRDKDIAIEQFLTFARNELKPYNVNLSADVFGFITRSWDDKPEDIGQTWRKMANQTDYMCPMIYPSHYGPGLYGFDVPDQHPYEISRFAVMEAIERNASQKNPGRIRPWFQGFNAPWVKGYKDYDAKAISDQIVASMELGIEEYIIWNATCNYEPMSFFYQDRVNKKIRKTDEDVMARTPEAALTRYLTAEKNRRYSHIYLLTPIAKRQEDFDAFVASEEKTMPVLKKYEIVSISKDDSGAYVATVNGEYNSNEGVAKMQDAKFKIVLENDVYKVEKPELTWEKL